MKLVPLFDKIIVKETNKKKESKTKSGIILPTSVKEQPTEAKVVAIGNGGILDGNEIEMQIAKGDIVLFHKYSASEFYFEDEEYLVLRQVDVLCKLEKDKNN
ncbi:MAG: co-chaperone GroES [Clostridia bacterium]|nr:co-chaperone GroES [Clostridia bacterium]